MIIQAGYLPLKNGMSLELNKFESYSPNCALYPVVLKKNYLFLEKGVILHFKKTKTNSFNQKHFVQSGRGDFLMTSKHFCNFPYVSLSKSVWLIKLESSSPKDAL